MSEDFNESVNMLINHAMANLHTSTVVKVVGVGATLLKVKPVIARVVDGEVKPLPVLVEVPRLVLQGGSSYYSMPISVGDYGMLFITERCFDNWYAGSDNIEPREMRMHDYSDGFYYGGVNPSSKLIEITDRIHEVGNKLYEGDLEHHGNTDQTGNVTLTGDETVTGNRNQEGTATITSVITNNLTFGTSKTNGVSGVTGSFNTSDNNRNITVTNGIITGIS